MLKQHLIVVLTALSIQSFSQKLAVDHFNASATTSYIENLPYLTYEFNPPLAAEVLSTPGFRSSAGGGKGDFFFSVFGPRYLSGFDFHGGADLTPRIVVDGVNHSDENTPDLLCMCDGEIVEIFDTWNETYGIAARGNGNTIKVKCDLDFSSADDDWGPVYLAYRHMGDMADLSLGSKVNKGAVIGKLGETGASGNAHLHFSLQRCSDPDGNCEDGDAKFENVHPMRVFDPGRSSHLHDTFGRGEVFIELLEESASESIFRLTFLQNQVAIHSIEIDYNGSTHASYVLEAANNAGDLDNPCFVDNICVYANPFNRYSTSYERYLDFTDGESNDLPEEFPSNPDHPILNIYPYNTPAFVLDVIVSNLPFGFDPSLLSIEVRDIYGSGARATASGFLSKTISNGDWNSATTWESGIVPLADDRIEVNHNLTLDGIDVEVKSVVISSTESTNSSLTIGSGASVVVSDYLHIIGSNEDRNTFLKIRDDNTSLTVQNDLEIKRFGDSDQVYFEIDDDSKLEVGGDLLFTADEYSKESGSTTQSPSLNIGTVNGDPKVEINGNMVINYGVEADKDIVGQIGRSSEPWNSPDISILGDAILRSNIGESGNTLTGLRLYANSILDVEGILNLDYNPSFLETRHDVVLELRQNSNVIVSDLIMNSHLSNDEINNSIQINDNGKLTIANELSLIVSENAIENQLAFNNQSTFELSGSIESIENGSFLVGSSSKITLSGNQEIRLPPVSGSFGILEITNTASVPVQTSSDVNIEEQLILENNILDLGSNSLLLSKDATLDVSDLSFIDGKIEQTIEPVQPGEEFIYPVGDGATKAPMKVLVTTTASQTVEIEYRKHSSVYDTELPLVEVGTGYWDINTSESVGASFGWTNSCDENIANISEDEDRSLYLSLLANNKWQQVVASNIVDGSEACDNQNDEPESGYLSVVNFGRNVFSLGKTKSSNSLPVFKQIANQHINESEELRLVFEATDIDNQALVYQIDDQSVTKGMKIDSQTGEFSWKPGESADGEHFITATVTDGLGIVSSSFSIIVLEINNAPHIDEIDKRQITGGREFSLRMEASDTDVPVQKLSYKLDIESRSKGMRIDSNSGLFGWTPTNDQIGDHEIEIIVSDGVEESSFKWSVSVVEGVVLNISEPPIHKLFPNPFDDRIIIHNSDRIITKIELINSVGQLVYSVIGKSAAIELDTKSLNSGIYFIHLYDKGENQIDKLKVFKK